MTCSDGYTPPPSCPVPPPEAESLTITDVPIGSAKVITCNDVCETCESTSTNCLTCDKNRINAPTCSCDSGYYEDSDSLC